MFIDMKTKCPPTTKRLEESLEQAARRLLAKMDARKISAGEKPAEIHEISQRPLAESAGEAAAISASFTGQRGLGDNNAVVVRTAANDNAGWTSGELCHGASPAPYSDDSATPADRAKVTLRGFGEW